MITRGDVFAVGGVERSVVRLAKGLAATGEVEVDVVELRPDLDADLTDGIFDIDPTDLGDGVPHYRLRAWCSSPSKSERDFALHMALVELCERREYALLHGMYASTAGFAAAYAAAEHRLPSVVSLRGNDIHRDVYDARRFGHLVWALGQASAVTAVSAEALRRADLLAGCGDKGTVIHNGIDPAMYRDGVERVATGAPLIGSLAKFRAKKGLATLLQAFGMLLTDHPGAHLLLAGDINRDERDTTHRLIAEAGLTDRITITGYVERVDAMRYIRGMDVFVLSSLHEGCPNALLEAMVAGVPIVSTAVGAVPDMLTDGDEAVLVRPGCATALADGVRRVLGGDSAALGVRARAAALTRFTPGRELAEFLAVYRACLGG